MSIAEEIHEASLALLEEPGVKVEHEGIRALLMKHGAKAGAAADVVRIPREMVKEAIEVAPKEVALADRRGNKKVLKATGETVFWSCPGMQLYRHGEHRLFTPKDM